MSEYRVLYRRGADGQWVATVPGRRRCRGKGRTLRKARQALRAALARVVEDPDRIDLAEDVRLPPPARRLLVQYWRARRKSEREARGAEAAAQAALLSLVALKLNVKDAGDLLGLPPQKLQRLRARADRDA